MNRIVADQKHSSLLPGDARSRMDRAIAQLRAGGGVLVVDDEDRENEGDLIFPAATITDAQMAQMIRDGSGIVCLILTEEKLRRLDLPLMVGDNTSRYGTGFTISIEAREGVTTGVSAADRVTTIRTAIDDGCRPEDLARPGHMFPIRAHPGGLTARRGHSEATIALMELSGHPSAGILCEVMNPDGTMARLPQLRDYADRHGLPLITIDDIVAVMNG